jgi:hypothetical protein
MRDDFPPFSLSADAPAGSRAATGTSAAAGFGGVVIVGVVVLFAALALTKDETVGVSYNLLAQGQDSSPIEVDNVDIHLTDADDSYNFPGDLLVPESGSRFVMIEAEVHNRRIADINMERLDFWLRDDDGERHDPTFVSLDGVAPPVDLRRGGITGVLLVFEVEGRADPADFFYNPDNALRNARFIFE